MGFFEPSYKKRKRANMRDMKAQIQREAQERQAESFFKASGTSSQEYIESKPEHPTRLPIGWLNEDEYAALKDDPRAHQRWVRDNSYLWSKVDPEAYQAALNEKTNSKEYQERQEAIEAAKRARKKAANRADTKGASILFFSMALFFGFMYWLGTFFNF